MQPYLQLALALHWQLETTLLTPKKPFQVDCSDHKIDKSELVEIFWRMDEVQKECARKHI